ncbi:hypothetical protein CYMTET_14064 [Cymbomonas tetramitiformis]|uniref:Uncharacterized protein n=1 Tax=Cymbomonas tetramitiformis TaxID=36881 RepID=A0AAE0GHA3_9CHLO|nr:hypothetical protein CYMTET_14064 [Cymbomonas tetramitiformis]
MLAVYIIGCTVVFTYRKIRGIAVETSQDPQGQACTVCHVSSRQCSIQRDLSIQLIILHASEIRIAAPALLSLDIILSQVTCE